MIGYVPQFSYVARNLDADKQKRIETVKQEFQDVLAFIDHVANKIAPKQLTDYVALEFNCSVAEAESLTKQVFESCVNLYCKHYGKVEKWQES